MARQNGFLDRLSEMAGMQDEPIPGQPLVEIGGYRRVLIENHSGVIEYADTAISVKVKFGTVCVLGSNLKFLRMTKQQLIIGGCIDCVRLVRR